MVHGNRYLGPNCSRFLSSWTNMPPWNNITQWVPAVTLAIILAPHKPPEHLLIHKRCRCIGSYAIMAFFKEISFVCVLTISGMRLISHVHFTTKSSHIN